MRMSTRLFLPFWTLSKVLKKCLQIVAYFGIQGFWLDIMFENHQKKSHFTKIIRYPLSQISHATSCTAQFWPFSIYEYNRNYKGHSFLDNLRHYWIFLNTVLEWKQACYFPTLSFFRCKYHISKSSKICKESAWQQEQSNRVEVVVEVLL